MKHILILQIVVLLVSSINGFSQENKDSLLLKSITNKEHKHEIKGLVLDKDKQTALAFTNIVVLGKSKGSISNENGYFSIDISGLKETDTISFQYLGYQNRNFSVNQLKGTPVVSLKENMISLNETFVFGEEPDAKEIIKKILENKATNYKTRVTKSKMFIRERYTADINKINIEFKKSSFETLNRKIIKLIENKLPNHTTSYTDFLGELYFSETQNDSVKLKVNPIKTISLKDKDIDFSQIESVFENVFANTKEKEYWKMKSGIFSSKIDIKGEEKEEKSGMVSVSANNDNFDDDNNMKTTYYRDNIEYSLEYSLMNDNKDWEFLYKTGKYKYTLAGGTKVNGEDVYIIDFEPQSSGKFVGRVYVSIETYALIRADYEYALGKTGLDIHLLGVGVSMNKFKASIYFEKKGDRYALKYFSRKTGQTVSINRSLSLLKKKERFLFDKKLNEIKGRIKMTQTSEDLTEILVLDENEITDNQFANFKQKKMIKIIYVNQFNDDLWNGFSIIEPTKQMKEYKKMD